MNDHVWNTQAETDFLDGLGHHVQRERPLTDAEKLVLLEGYEAGLALRVEWGNIDRERIRQHLAKRKILYNGLEEFGNVMGE